MTRLVTIGMILGLTLAGAGAGPAAASKPTPTPMPMPMPMLTPMLTPTPTPTPSAGTWTFTASLPDAQAYDAATLLRSGQVLVVGGYESRAELYTPATGTWTLTGPMNAARNLSTATLLANGKVLVAGGNANGPRASAELYNPATNTWTLTGSMHTARYQHTAILLQNGQVLVAGGYNPNATDPFLTSAELYNPATGTWTTTGSLHAARIYDTMTLLPTGQVLVAGGYNTSATAVNILASAELYNPATGHWTLTGSMHTPARATRPRCSPVARCSSPRARTTAARSPAPSSTAPRAGPGR